MRIKAARLGIWLISSESGSASVMYGDDEEKPPRVQPRIIGAPKVRSLFWCDFPKDAQLPEFWKRRPVIIISPKSTYHGVATVVPCSTHSQPQNPWAVKLKTSIDGKNQSWAVCDKITTVAVSRLSAGHLGLIRITDEEFEMVKALIWKWLPAPGKPGP